jgi:hypothetical protein
MARRKRRLTLPPRAADFAGRLELLRQADLVWSPPPLQALQENHKPISAWLTCLGWFRWQDYPDGPARRFVRDLLYSCMPWPSVRDLEAPRPVMLRKGERPPDLTSPTGTARQALARWGSSLPLKAVPAWMFTIAIQTVLHHGFSDDWRWVCQMPDFRLIPPVLGCQSGETEAQFRRRALRDFERTLSEYVRDLRHAYGAGLRTNDTREVTLRRDAEWMARFLAGTAAYRMSEDFDEDAVLRAVHRFCDRIGLDLATMRRPPEPFGRAQGRAQNAVLRQRLRSLCADAGSQSNLS